MQRFIGLVVALLIACALGASMATTASAAGTVHPIATPGSKWVIRTAAEGCENVALKTEHKWAADINGDGGTWIEPTHSTIALTWTHGGNKGTTFKGTFNPGNGVYIGKLRLDGIKFVATLVPGTKKGC